MNSPEQLKLPTSGTLPQQAAFRARRKAIVPAPLARVTLSVDEAASALGISRDHLERHILRDLRIIYTGRRRLIPVSELQRWAELQAVAPIGAPHPR